MAGRGGYSVTITAVDNASKQIEALNRRIAAIRAPVDRVQRSLGRFADVTGITKLSHGVRDLASRSLEAFRSVGRIVEPLAAITSAASIAGMLRLVSSWAQFGVASSNTAMRIGISVDRLQALQGAAALSGSSAEALTSGLESLGQTLYDAVGGRAPEAVVMFNTLGISIRDATGHARNAADAMPEIADKISLMASPYAQLHAAIGAGISNARELLPFLRRGSAGYAEYVALAERSGVMTKAGAAAAAELQFQQTNLKLATDGLSNSIAENLAPTLVPLMSDLAEWIRANRILIATDVGRYAKEIGDYLRGIDWKGSVTEVKDLGSEVNTVVGYFGGWKTVIEGIIALKLLGWVKALLTPLAELVALLGALPTLGIIGGYFGFKGAVKSGTEIGHAAELGLRPSSIPGSVDEFGNVNLYQGPDGKTYTPDDVEKMYRAKNPNGEPPAAGAIPPGNSLTQRLGRLLGIGGSPDRANPTAGDSAYKPLMDLVGRTEGTDRGRGYDETLGYGKYTGGNVDLQHMTLSQVDALQQKMLDNHAPSTAVGRYQIIRKTLLGLEQQEHLDPNTTLYSKALQDHLFAVLARGRGGDAYLAGGLSPSQFQSNLGKEWASIPQPGTGRSYYPGQGVGANSDEVKAAINRMSQVQDTTPVDIPSIPSDPPANIAGGTGAAPADVTHTVNGSADVSIRLGGNVPTGTTVGASTKGDLFQGAPRIHYAMEQAN